MVVPSTSLLFIFKSSYIFPQYCTKPQMRIKNIWLSTETVDTAKKIDANTSTETIKNMKSLFSLGIGKKFRTLY